MEWVLIVSYVLAFLHVQVVADHLSVEEVAGIKEAFNTMDSGKKGKINLEEFKMGLHKLGHQIPDADVQILMEAVRIMHYYLLLYDNMVFCNHSMPLWIHISLLLCQIWENHFIINQYEKSQCHLSLTWSCPCMYHDLSCTRWRTNVEEPPKATLTWDCLEQPPYMNI